jgi:hypothetical protein
MAGEEDETGEQQQATHDRFSLQLRGTPREQNSFGRRCPAGL